ncbi:hypothetical protein BKA70DRAFT_1465061 [Coprinopsis sp. MPI-PUGE-AT-0042]|nr:hypothetical protein BKA70DRAFT_1465061 [Coprinopsis sp. MPI-PUGE-AT-0042]
MTNFVTGSLDVIAATIQLMVLNPILEYCLRKAIVRYLSITECLRRSSSGGAIGGKSLVDVAKWRASQNGMLGRGKSHHPAPQHDRLAPEASPSTGVNTGIAKELPSTKVDDDEDPLTTPPSTPSRSSLDPDKSNMKHSPKTPSKAKGKSSTHALIVVTLEHESDRKIQSLEAFVTGVPVVAEHDDEGRASYTARLSELIPGAFSGGSDLSPIKNRRSRISRQGVADSDSRSSLGLLDDILDPSRQPIALTFDTVNRYKLEQKKEGLFACKLFWKEVPTKSDKNSDPSNGTIVETAAGGGAMHHQGDDSDIEEISNIPILKAKANQAARKEAQVSNTDREKEPKIGFNEFLRGMVGVSTKDLVLGKAQTMDLVLKRYKLRQRVMEFVEHECIRRSGHGGFQVPDLPRYETFRNQEFTKTHVLQALQQGTTQANNDDSLLGPDRLLKFSSKAQEWVKSPDGPHADEFAKMSAAKFRKMLEQRRDAKVKARAESSAMASTSGASKKRRRSGEDDSDGESKEKRRRSGGGGDMDVKGKGKGKKKSKEVYDSDNLDSNSTNYFWDESE